MNGFVKYFKDLPFMKRLEHILFSQIVNLLFEPMLSFKTYFYEEFMSISPVKLPRLVAFVGFYH